MVTEKNQNIFRLVLNTKRAVDAFSSIPRNNSDVDSVINRRKQIKYGTNCQAIKGIFSEYCDHSTIHGMKYLGEQKRPIIERCFWIFVFLLSIYTCSRLTMNIYNKWTYNPVIVTFAEKSTPVWEIPFPTVTVCTENKFDSKIVDFNYYWVRLVLYNNLTETESFYYEAISQMCQPHPQFNGFGKPFANTSDLVRAMEKTSVWFNHPCWECKWQNNETDCCKQFHRVLTEEGICYSFNSLDPKDIYRDEAVIDESYFGQMYDAKLQWSLDGGYNPNADIDTFPYRVFKEGAKAGVTLDLHGYNQTFNYLCRIAVKGFKILLNTPGEIPRVSEQYIPIPYNHDVLISIKPEIITTSEGLKHYDPMSRHCYMQDERYLRYFRAYTQNNCKLECLSNFTMKYCGCVKFSMPRSVDTPVCGSIKIGCMRKAEDELSYGEFRQTFKKPGRGSTETGSCNCLPACTSIVYNTEISQTDSFRRNTHNEYEQSSLSIFFKEAQFLSSKRSELYGKTDFLANCGGLLGLFMGVSTLSIVELVYFCTVRLISNLKMRRRNLQELERNQPVGSAVVEANEVKVQAARPQ